MTRPLTALAALSFASLLAAPAAAQIKEPGQHPMYTVEIDPHLLVQYGDRATGDQGLGFGLRGVVPFVHNGPVPSINNNIGASVGVDVAFFGDDDRCRRRGFGVFVQDCSAWNLWVPATAQWNFFLTPIVSVYAELGLALQYQHWSFQGLCSGGAPCSGSDSNTDVEPTAFVGGRFLIFSRRAGLTVRLGWPYMAVGAAMLF
jgi:hypothetical protein